MFVDGKIRNKLLDKIYSLKTIHRPTVIKCIGKLIFHIQMAAKSENLAEKSEQTMHALVWHGAQDIRYEKVPKPTIRHPCDVILRVTCMSICGSDLRLYSGKAPGMKKGDIAGHEFMGVVEQAGDQVAKIKPGDRVVVCPFVCDGVCDYCQRGEYSACTGTNEEGNERMEELYGTKTSGVFGFTHLSGGYAGGQAEFVRVPFADVNCLEVPRGIEDVQALFIPDVVCTAFWACEMVNIGPGDVVGIWGLGPIGLMSAMWSLKRGAQMVIGIDCVPERLRIAEEILRINTINFKETKNLHTSIQNLLPEDKLRMGGLDACIEAVGSDQTAKEPRQSIEKKIEEEESSEILNDMIMSTRSFGRVSVVGGYFGKMNNFPMGAILNKTLTLRAGKCPAQRYWKEILEKVENQEIDPSFIVTHKLSLSKGAQAYKDFFEHKDGFVKAFITP